MSSFSPISVLQALCSMYCIRCLKEEERGSQLGELNRELEAKMQEISTTNNQLKREISKYKVLLQYLLNEL